VAPITPPTRTNSYFPELRCQSITSSPAFKHWLVVLFVGVELRVAEKLSSNELTVYRTASPPFEQVRELLYWVVILNELAMVKLPSAPVPYGTSGLNVTGVDVGVAGGACPNIAE